MADMEGAIPLHTKDWWRSKTIWVNGAMLIGGVLTALTSYVHFSPLWLAVLSAVNIWLRTITTQAVSLKPLDTVVVPPTTFP